MTQTPSHRTPHAVQSRIAGLYVLLDDDPRWPLDPVAQCEAACAGGARIVQLRAKHASDETQLEWARAIRACTRRTDTLFFVNDRFDLALLTEADGVHLGQEDFPPTQLPCEARAKLLVGRSTHDMAQAERAVQEAVDYIAFGPIFGTTSKESVYAAQGLVRLAAIVGRVTPIPVVAIGGITLDNAPQVLRAGASAISVIAAIAGAPQPQLAAKQFSALFSATEASYSVGGTKQVS